LKPAAKLFIFIGMSASAKPRPKTAPRGRVLTYRGVTLQKPATASRFSSNEIKKAVEDAVAKHADSLAHGK
jgi:hypothetical protein